MQVTMYFNNSSPFLSLTEINAAKYLLVHWDMKLNIFPNCKDILQLTYGKSHVLYKFMNEDFYSLDSLIEYIFSKGLTPC